MGEMAELYDYTLDEEETKMKKVFYIAGVQFRPGIKQVIDELDEGMELELVPEPENKFDPNAVQVCYKGIQLGFVPKKFSAEVAGILEVDNLMCRVVEINKAAKPWEQCKITVTEMEEQDD